MNSRQEYEVFEEKLLAPYGQFSSASLGRQHQEEECPLRTCFHRDMARVIHSTAFRRLEYKTQVFIKTEGDYYRSRLTHSVEVGQIAKGLARIIGVNEDLAQAIALAHDLGHTPFGHPGEEALNQLMKPYGGFEHNLQGYRVVTVLEHNYPNFRGLNLTYEVLEGIIKHKTSYDKPSELEGFKSVGHPTLEAQIVSCADEIAFMSHDLDDGIQYGMLTLKSLGDVPLWDEIFRKVQKDIPTAPDKVKKSRVISGLINTLIIDLRTESKKRIAEAGIKTLSDVRERGENIISLSHEMGKKAEEAKKFLLDNVYCHKKVVRMREKAVGVIEDLFQAYSNNPRLLPDDFYRHLNDTDNKRLICDYIAGMTDRFALQEHKKLFRSSDSGRDIRQEIGSGV